MSGINTEYNINVNFNSDTKGAEAVRKELDNLDKTTKTAGKSVDKLENSVKTTGKTAQATSKQTQVLSEKTEDLGDKTAITTEHIKAFIAAYVGIQTIGNMLASIADTDSLGKLSDRLGVATEELSGLEYAAGLAGMEADKFRDSLKDLTKNSAEAAAGTGEAVDSFKKLGINLKDANGNLKTQPVLIREVADSIIKIKSDSEQAAVAMKIFGESGLWMLNLLKTGSSGINEAVKQAQELGIIVTTEQAKQAAQTADDISRMEQAWDGVRRQLSMAVAPAMSEVSVEIRDLAGEMAKFLQTAEGQETVKELVDTLGDLAEVGVEGIAVVGKLTAAFGDFLPIALKTYLAIKGFGLLGGVFGALSGGAGTVKSLNAAWAEMGLIMSGNALQIESVSESVIAMNGSLTASGATMQKVLQITPRLIESLGLMAAAIYAVKEGTEYLLENYSVMGRQLEADKNQTRAMKDIAEAMEITRKSAEQLNNLSELELTDEYAKASAEVRTLNLLLTQMKISEEPKAEIEAISEKLKAAKEYMQAINNTGFNIQGMDDFKGAMTVLDDTLKKSGEELAKNLETEQKTFELKYKQLSLYNQENQARQAESSHYRNIITEVSGRYLTESAYISNLISDIRRYTSSEKASADEVKKMAVDVMNKKLESANRYKEVLLTALDAAIQKEKAYKSELEGINQAIVANSKDTNDKLKALSQGWMTEAQVAIDNYYRAFQKYNEAEQLAIKAKTATDKDEKAKLIAQANDYYAEAKNGIYDYAVYLQGKMKEIQASTKTASDNTASVFDTVKNSGSAQIKTLTTTYNEAVKTMLQISEKIKGSLTDSKNPVESGMKTIKEDVESIEATINNIDKEIQLTVTESGLDEIKKAYDNIKDKTVTITYKEKTVQYRNSGGLINGGRVHGVGNTDTVDAKLTPGEFVHRQGAVNYYGLDIMRRLNSMSISRERLAEALNGIRKPAMMPYIPDLSKIKTAGSAVQPKETASFEIVIGDARLQGSTTPDMLAEFEKQTRRQKYCVVKKRKI